MTGGSEGIKNPLTSAETGSIGERGKDLCRSHGRKRSELQYDDGGKARQRQELQVMRSLSRGFTAQHGQPRCVA